MTTTTEKFERLKELRKLIKSEQCLVDLAEADLIPGAVICLNPHSIMVALDDDEFFDSIKNAAVIVIDGIGLYFVARFFWKVHVSHYRVFVCRFFRGKRGTSALRVSGLLKKLLIDW